MLIRPLVLAALLACPAGAQVIPGGPPNVPPAMVADTVPAPFERPNGSLLRPGTVTYDLSSSRAGQLASLGTRTVQVSESTVAGMPAWLVTESRTGSAVATTDSLYLTRAELMPVRWSATSGRAVLGASFARDTAFGALQSYQGRASFTVGAAGSALVTPGMVERIVEMLPLHVGYHALASLLVVEMSAPRVQPAELVVDREEPLQLGDQVVACWVVTLRSGGAEEHLWVTKDSLRVVKTEQLIGGATLTALVHPPAPVMPVVVPADSSGMRPLAVPPVVPPTP
ncbi:MAG: hypothetical protein JWN79_3382 [Gemmatimonadetes bacterium]|jgi:hypothetical protein|nr:hypothetical protein [Gemmatimonadota bacterium]